MKKILPFLILFGAPLKAEPDKTVRHLMTDSPSMLEWGMFKIDNAFSNLIYDGFEPIKKQRFNVSYDWDQNELNLSMSVYPSNKVVNEQGANNICREVLTAFKKELGYESISKYFEHKAFTRKEQTDTFRKDIERMTRITITVHSNKHDKSPYFSQAKCTNKFVEKAIYFEDNQ